MNEGRFQYGKSQRFEDTISIKTQAKISGRNGLIH